MTEQPAPPLTISALNRDDLPDILELDANAFGLDAPDEFLHEVIVPELELDRFVGARDPAAGNRLVAAACIFSKRLTFPGGAVHPAAGVSWVAVRPGWRRRGLLRGLITRQLQDLHDSGGEPVAILTASEGSLYGRFGYGRAIDRGQFRLAHGAQFRPGVAVDTVTDVHPDEAHGLVKELHARVASTMPGYLERTDAVWLIRFSDHEVIRGGASRRRFGVHQDGYVSYRIKPGSDDRGPSSEVLVDEICAATPRAFASLWRFLLDLDLTREITYGRGWLDDPLQDLLLDPRRLTLSRYDHVWLRIVDLDRAIGLRGYRSTASVVVEVTDSGCPWNQGRWAFDLDELGGAVARTTAPAAITMDIRDLGACLLGGTPLGRLVDGGLVSGDPVALGALGAALSTPVLPWCPEGF